MTEQPATKISRSIGGPAAIVTVDNFRDLADPVIENSFRMLLKTIDADAAAIWLVNTSDRGQVLTIAYNVGGRGAEIEKKVSQPLDSGLVSKAFRESATICHDGFFSHKEQSSNVDTELHQLTAHQIAAPFKIAGTLIGAATVVQVQDAKSSSRIHWGFEKPAIELFENWVAVTGRLFELNLRRAADA
jgi:hypothetical protein